MFSRDCDHSKWSRYHATDGGQWPQISAAIEPHQ